MKAFLAMALALVFLGASAAVLLRTEQAPLPMAPAEEAPPAPVVPAEPEKVVMTTEAFRILSAEVMGSVPNRDSFKKGEDLPILVAGERFGIILESVGDDPGLQAEASTLFQECAASGQYQDGVRALCYWHLRSLARKTGKAVSRNAAPPHIKALAEQL